MGVQLAILGFLREKDFYGYELKKVMERFMAGWADIKFGSIYYALERLARDGLVEPIRQEKSGSNPARTIYRITETGRQSFMKMLKENLTDVQSYYMPLDIGLFFSFNLEKEDVAKILRDRVDMLHDMLKLLVEQEQRLLKNPGIPEIAAALVTHLQAHLEADRNWVEGMVERYENRDLFEGKKMSDYFEMDRQHRTVDDKQVDRIRKRVRVKE